MKPDIDLSMIPATSCTWKYIKKWYPELYEYLGTTYPDLSFSEKVYWYKHDLHEHPVCKTCGKPTTYINMNRGYHTYCCSKCAAPDNMEKINKTKEQRYGDYRYNNRAKCKKTCLEKYGCEYSGQAKSVKEKREATLIERYGAIGFASKQIRDKVRQSNLERYGTEIPMQLKEISDKTKNTKAEKYGDPGYNNKDKRNKTNLERYGVVNPFQAEQFKEKAKQTMMDKYGVEYSHQSDQILQKVRQNSQAKYGTDYPVQAEEVKDKIKKSNRRYIINSHDFIEDIPEDRIWVCKCPHPECNQCDEKNYVIPAINYLSRKEFNIEPCTRLKPVEVIRNNNTAIETFVKNILDNHNINYICNKRSIIAPLELDIYIPDHNIAIECNGVFWHSTHKKDDNYHIDKWKKCRDAGIQLITIWEDQIIHHPDIVESIILSKLGIYDMIIGARKTTVREIKGKECTKFLDENHIQGRTNASVHLGMFYNDELVGVMTFSGRSKLSGSKKIEASEWELSRFCTKRGMSITGGFSKLLKYFISAYNPSVITSFASNDISNGSLYKKNGFVEDGTPTSSYWYVHKTSWVRYHRTSFTKVRLKQMGYDTDGRTEREIMMELPYHRIYDSGHTKYTLTL